jgi:hypothetical protein
MTTGWGKSGKLRASIPRANKDMQVTDYGGA